jgi:hypothetical protein
MCAGQILLAGIAVGHPDVGPVISKHFYGDTACPAWRDLVQHRLVRDEHPLPLSHPLVRVVVSSEAMIRALRSFSSIARVAVAMS